MLIISLFALVIIYFVLLWRLPTFQLYNQYYELLILVIFMLFGVLVLRSIASAY
jgi:hypothetical protein